MKHSRNFYLVRKGSDADKIITEGYAKRDATFKARWKIVAREFPMSTQKEYRKLFKIASYWNPHQWSVEVPDGVEIPPQWKKNRDGTFGPRLGTKAGKALHAEMTEGFLPGAGSIGKQLGIDSVWDDMTLIGIGILVMPSGQYVLELAEGHKVPAGVARISDVSLEKMKAAKTKPKRSKALSRA